MKMIMLACPSSRERYFVRVLMEKRDWGELCLVVLSLALFVGYHVFMYVFQSRLWALKKSNWFNVYETAGMTRLLWTHAIVSDDKDAITGVQTLRNAIMVCALLATASAYLGGRALPSILFDPSWKGTLDGIAVSG